MTFSKLCSALTLFLVTMQIAGLNNLSVKIGGADIQNNITSSYVENALWIDQNDSMKRLPVLCYHYVKRNISKGSQYVLPENEFQKQMITLRDSGYTTILPDALYSFHTKGVALPAKPIMLTFDDTYEEHYSIVAPILNQLGFKAVFFANTVVIGKPGYMTEIQLKELSENGHAIGGHTWNHPHIKQLKERDLIWQIDKPKQELEKITGKPVQAFAYPYGIWNDAAISKLKKHGVTTAFQLSEKPSKKNPLHTIRRLLVWGTWTEDELLKHMATFFLPPDD
jgi:peptidoglycan/xylan/chitin deacetylase (PgdA/CDA1 family)